MNRKDAGKKVFSYGPINVLKMLDMKRPSNTNIEIKLKDYQLKTNTKYMRETLQMKSESLTNMSKAVAYDIIVQNDLKELVIAKQVIFGRIRLEKDQNVINALLEPANNLFMSSKAIPLALNQLKSFTLIPGQTVVLKGFNVVQTKHFCVEKLYSNSLPMPNKIVLSEEQFEMLIASGPFTLPFDLKFKPLQDLLKYIVQNKPNIFMLIGPFYEGNYDFKEENLDDETYQSFFESLVSSVMEPLKGLNVKVVLVSSNRDKHHHIVYPTPPYKLCETYENLYLCPDPAFIDISGVKIGATSVDIIAHMISKEVTG